MLADSSGPLASGVITQVRRVRGCAVIIHRERDCIDRDLRLLTASTSASLIAVDDMTEAFRSA